MIAHGQGGVLLFLKPRVLANNKYRNSLIDKGLIIEICTCNKTGRGDLTAPVFIFHEFLDKLMF